MESSPGNRILIVDDEESTLLVLQTFLETEGYDVDLANNGTIALKKITASLPDLILLDVMMPDMLGYEVIWRIRQDYASSIPIILMTGFDEQIAPRVLELGVDDFIRKPFMLEQLLEKVKNLCC